MYTYSIFILHIEFHFARIHIVLNLNASQKRLSWPALKDFLRRDQIHYSIKPD
jgi:hypothetical protein